MYARYIGRRIYGYFFVARPVRRKTRWNTILRTTLILPRRAFTFFGRGGLACILLLLSVLGAIITVSIGEVYTQTIRT